VSNAALFLCSDEASCIMATVLHVDGDLSRLRTYPSSRPRGRRRVRAGRSLIS